MEYLIKNTTKEQRIELVKKALGISITGAQAPTNEATKLAREYIDGKKELEEIQKEMIERYKKI